MRLRIQAHFVAFAVLIAAMPAAAQLGQGGTVSFSQGENAVGIPFELNSDKIYLSVRLNGAGPYWLVLDTGSPGMILDTRVGEDLDVATGEAFEVGGAGENAFRLAPAEITFEATLPGLVMSEQPAHIGGIDAIVGPFEGRIIHGVLGGYNVFMNYIVEVDYAAQTISVFERDTYEAEAGGTEVSIQVMGGHSGIEATAVLANGDRLDGLFMIDTGLRGNLVFNTPFVNEHKLLDRVAPNIYTTMGGGVGGQVKVNIGRIDDFVFGGFSVGSIYVSLSQLESGALAAEAIAGIIGSAVLQRFRVVFDYAGERLILYPADYDKGRLDMDKSGMFLVADLDDRAVYRVIDVVDGSPAARAGLVEGDIIRTIDGRPAPSLEQARRLFRKAAGTRYGIGFERGGETREATLTLEKVI